MIRNKIRLCEYFDNLISRLDLVVEKLIIANIHDKNLEAGFNKQRDEFIKEIRYVEAYIFRTLTSLPPQSKAAPFPGAREN